MKVIIVIVLLAVLASLASAGLFMLKRRPKEGTASRDARMARALAVRVGLSIALFLLVLLAWRMGWIQPAGLPVGR